jgi:hypothetical protein
MGYEGALSWHATVTTNDPNIKIFTIWLKAFVSVPIYISPRYAGLGGTEGESVTKSIEIKAGLEKPLSLEPSEFNLEGKATYKIEEIEKGRIFKVHITNVPGVAGYFRGLLKLKTNYDEKPIIAIKINGQFVKRKSTEK